MSIKSKTEEPEGRELLFKSLYLGAFPGVCKYISKMGGSLDEAKDVFQDALVIYFEQVQMDRIQLNKSEKAYLFGISRNLWKKRFGENKRNVSIEARGQGFEENNAVSDSVYQEVSSERLLRLLSRAGEKCMQLLSAFYYEQLGMDVIADRFGFSGSRSATVQKFKCLEKIKETVKERSLQYEDIIE